MHVIGMLALGTGGREAEHAARVDRLQGQATGHQLIEDAVERDAIHRRLGGIGETRFKLGVRQRLARREQGVEHAHAAARELDPGGADQLGGRVDLGGGKGTGHGGMKPQPACKCNKVAFTASL